MNGFSVVAAYNKKLWFEYLKEYDIQTTRIPWSLSYRALVKLSKYIGNTINAWRKLTPYFHPIIRTLLEKKCDLWIFPSQDPLSYQVPVPSLVAIHDLMHRYEHRFPELSANGQYQWREKFYSNVCRFSKGILVDSTIGKKHVVESYATDPQKIHLLPYIPPKYIYSDIMVSNFNDRYKLPPKFIFYPAHFWEHKNHANLLRAASIIKNKLPNIHLVFVGSKKNNYDRTVDMIHELGLKDSVDIFEYVSNEDLAEIYRLATALVMPTFLGPTNIPPLEAFILGCPVAVSNNYGMPKQVGDAGLLFDPNNIHEIANVIEILWTDHKKRQKLITRGFAKSKEWDQQKFNLRLKSIIETVIQ
ncbi:glycosyltransferase family 1 protein [Desulfobacteraceae bacterium SEEP-SAG10]|nr:glycosyltransferase family 1 protein [Desulfobacteraceae bacterium SEEP-SAG10]